MKNMNLLQRIAFSDALWWIMKIPAWPYNWAMRTRLNFICGESESSANHPLHPDSAQRG
jgi:hypothetical protein